MSEKKQLKLKNKVPLVEIVILGEGKNTHVVVPFGKSYEIGNVTYTPTRENIFLKKQSFKPDRYVAVFNKKGEPVKLETDTTTIKTVTYVKDGKETKKIEKTKTVEVTAQTLNIAHNSQSLKNGLAELFKNPLDGRKFLFIGAVVIVAVVVFMVMSGNVVL